MPLTAQLFQALPHNDRRDRVSVQRGGTLRAAEGTPIDVTIINLSATGVIFSTNRELPIGGSASLGIPSIGMRAIQVVRRSGHAYGCMFLEELRQDEIDSSLSAETIVVGKFDQRAAPPSCEPVTKWPVTLRVGFIASASLGLWGSMGLAYVLVR